MTENGGEVVFELAMSDASDDEKVEVKKRTDGFFRFGLNKDLVHTIVNRLGFRLPSPIQRVAIPTIMKDRDAMIMSRTGSGKTAAFMIPIMHLLGDHCREFGVRCIILVPTIELCVQTARVAGKLASFRSPPLSVFAVHGNGQLEEQFLRLSSAPSPDIVVATPSRLAKIIRQMSEAGDSFELRRLKHLVMDEADELLSQEHINIVQELIGKVGTDVQKILVSATLPSALAQFRKANMKPDAEHVRLADEDKLSDTLSVEYVHTRPEDKAAALVHLCRSIVPGRSKVVIFACSRHHVEYLAGLVATLGVTARAIYGSLDPAARKEAMMDFTKGVVPVLITTDLAARGLDVPMLDVVINYDFPPSAKLFVHRTGRVARMGRAGQAWSLVTRQDTPYLVDLHTFLGLPLPDGVNRTGQVGPIGCIPQTVLDVLTEEIKTATERSDEIQALLKSATGAYKAYYKNREGASKPAVSRSGEVDGSAVHPTIAEKLGMSTAMVEQQQTFLQAVAGYKPRQAGIEMMAANSRSDRGRETLAVLSSKRDQDDRRIASKREDEARRGKRKGMGRRTGGDGEGKAEREKVTFGKYQEAGFMAYDKARVADDRYLAIDGDISGDRVRHVDDKVMDIVGEESSAFRKKGMVTRWDKKSRNFVNVNKDQKDDVGSVTRRIKNDAGVWVTVTGDKRENQYQSWKKRTKATIPKAGATEDDATVYVPPKFRRGEAASVAVKGPAQARKAGTGGPRQLQSVKKVVKAEIAKEKKQAWEEERRKFHEAQRKRRR